MRCIFLGKPGLLLFWIIIGKESRRLFGIGLRLGFPECGPLVFIVAHNNACNCLFFGKWSLPYCIPPPMACFEFPEFCLFPLFVSISLQSYLSQIELIQSYQLLEVNRFSQPRYDNGSTQSPIKSRWRGIQSIESILRKNESIHVKRLNELIGMQVWLEGLLCQSRSIL